MKSAHSTPVDLLIFDLDGTLADTLQDLANALNFALTQLGRESLSLEKIRQYIGDGVVKFLERAIHNPRPEEIESALRSFREFYQVHLTEFTRLYPGAQEVLLHYAGKKKAILTNKPEEYALPLIERLGLHSYFDLIIAGNGRRALKPDPQGIREILEKTAVPAQQAVMIGDSENDVLAGQAAGCLTFFAAYGFRNPERVLPLHPDFWADNLPALKSLFI